MTTSAPSSSTSLLEMRGIVKSFPGSQALRGVNFSLKAGEVLALGLRPPPISYKFAHKARVRQS